MKLRYTNPEIKRSFSCPKPYLIGSISLITCAYLAIKLLQKTPIIIAVAYIIGIMLYIIYGYRHSNLIKKK